MRHLDDGGLQAWLDHPRSGLTDAEHADMDRHLSVCAACRDRMAELDGTTLRVRDLFAPATVLVREIPEWSDVVARAEGNRNAPGRPSLWRSVGWAAGIAAVMGAGWLSNDLYRRVEAEGTIAPPTAAVPVPPPPARQEAESGATGRDTARNTDVAIPSPQVARVAEAKVADAGASILRGRVTDESGRPLAAAQVYVEGTGLGALTNSDGAFQFHLPPSSVERDRDVTLTAQLLGYASVNRRLATRPGDTVVADMRLAEQALALDQIVVTGAAAPGSAARERRGLAPAPGGRAPATDGLVGTADFEVAGGGLVVPWGDLAWGGPWITTDAAGAAERTGFAPLLIDDLGVVEIAAGGVGDAAVLRVVQELDDGVRVTLFEANGTISFAPMRPAAAGVRATASVFRSGVGIAASALIPTDSLEALLRRVR